jgi:ribonucleoside-diphosphate reductase alpha chain
MSQTYFKTPLAETVFHTKRYAHNKHDTWRDLAVRLVDDVCGVTADFKDALLPKSTRDELVEDITSMKFIPGGRYLYYAGRGLHAWNNCYLLRGIEDTREEWGALLQRSSDCLMTGGGIGIDYSVFRCKGQPLSRTGGTASGPLPLMQSINEVGRNVMQGGSRRSAIFATLNWQHGDIDDFLTIKDWQHVPVGKAKHRDGSPYTLRDAKMDDFNYPAPLDMTNISPSYDDAFLSLTNPHLNPTFLKNCGQALMTGEPGFTFNFGKQSEETLRNACTEVTSEDDSDVCNLGSLNLGNINNVNEAYEVACRASAFLACGTVRADLPYKKVYEVREKNRRLGLGIMGTHEWLLKRGKSYEVDEEFKLWLSAYAVGSQHGSNATCKALNISQPIAYRAIAPTGTIAILASTTTGIEPLYAVAYKRRYLTEGSRWKYQFVVDATADYLIKQYDVKPDSIETASNLAADPEKRIKFQADVQDYVDMAISSTINMPAWGSDLNNEDKVKPFAKILAQYAPRLRGFTCYPDGSRGGQPITQVPYEDAVKHEGVVFEENDICDLTGKGGPCGV